MKVVFQRLHDSAVLPVQTYGGDAGHDLYAVEDCCLEPARFARVSTGLAMTLPVGTWARIVGRSSTFAAGLLVREGIIDNGYRGELMIGLFNISASKIVVKKGERLAQLIFQTLIVPELEFGQVDSSGTQRGSRGEGSTGT